MRIRKEMLLLLLLLIGIALKSEVLIRLGQELDTSVRMYRIDVQKRSGVSIILSRHE